MLTIDVSDLEKEIQGNVDQLLERIANDLVNELKREAPVDTGRLRQSFQILQYGDGELIVGSRLGYALDVQTGTEPHWVDIEPLKKWARRKLGAEELAYAVQRKIAEEGTNPNPYVDRALESLQEKYG